MKPLPRVVLTSVRSVVFIAGLTLLALGLTDCATRRIEKQQQVAVIPQPDRWREFVARADRGEIEEVSDGPEEREITSHGVSPRAGAAAATPADSMISVDAGEVTSFQAEQLNTLIVADDCKQRMRALPRNRMYLAEHFALRRKPLMRPERLRN